MTEATIQAQEGEICTGNAQGREAKVSKMISEAPESVRATLSQAFSGSASPRKAIKAMCLSCVGYDRNSVKNCTGWSCPLWKYRPFQD